MKRLFALALIIALFSLALGIIAAQDEPFLNDPNVNEDANACLTGGSLEGKCWDDPDMWNTGWYLIRFQYGIIAREIFPDQHKWALPRLTEEALEPCYIEVAPAIFELAPKSVLNGANGGSFVWHFPTYLTSTTSPWNIWLNGVWLTGHYGDCSPL